MNIGPIISEKEEIDYKLTALLKAASKFAPWYRDTVDVPGKFIPRDSYHDECKGRYTPGNDHFTWSTWYTSHHNGDINDLKSGEKPITIDMLEEMLTKFSNEVKIIVKNGVVEKFNQKLYEDEINHAGIQWID